MATTLAALITIGVLLPSGGAQTVTASSADEVLSRARDLYFGEGPSAALPVYEKALALYREDGDRLGEAITLGLIGNCYKRLGDYDRSLDLLSEALEMKRQIGNRLEEGKTLSHLGLLFWEQAEYDEAIRHLKAAIAIGEEIDDAKLEGSALNNLSLVYDELGDYEQSLQQYERALELYRRTDFPRGEGDTLGNIGGVHYLLGRYRQAIDYYEKALAISERLDSKPAISQDLGNLALCHLDLGEIAEALESFDRALALAQQAGLEKETADWQKGKGSALLETGRHSEGMLLVRQALATYESAGLDRELTEALEELAVLHLQMGDPGTAEGFLKRSLELSRSIGFSRGVLFNLVALGELEWSRERYDEAVDFFTEALAGAKEDGDLNLTTQCHTQLAFTRRDQGDLETALAEARKAVALADERQAKFQLAEAFFALGDIELRRDKAVPALEHFRAGERQIVGFGEPEIAWRLAHGRGRALEALGRDAEAVEAYSRAVELIETVRGRLREERFRAGYIEDKTEAYIDLSRVLIRLGRQEQALSCAERLRARTYLDMLSEHQKPSLTVEQRRREAELRQRVRRLQKSIEEELDPSYEPRRQAMEYLTVELSEAEREYEEFLSDLMKVDPGLARNWTLAVPSAAAIQQALTSESALLEFMVGSEEVLVFLLRPGSLRTKSVQVARRDLRAKVELTRELIRRRNGSDWSHPARSLSSLLIGPVEDAGWLDEVRHLYVVPHDVLHYLPFAALPRGDPGRCLVQDYDLTYLPAAGNLVYSIDTPPAREGILAIAPQNRRLRFTIAEARSVAEAFPDSNHVLTGAHATEHSFKQLAGRYRVLHLATHSYWNRLNPLLSGLELEAGSGEDGRLEVHEILDLQLRADLVTLSGCETALGSSYYGNLPVGDDFVGLTRAFMDAGGERVLASLWEVDDESTLNLMKSFYDTLGEGSPAASLAAAQRLMLDEKDPADPYQWAAFVMVGPGE
jgi:CHAT domain-containing protein/Tfp pilus assembly protein PilF